MATLRETAVPPQPSTPPSRRWNPISYFADQAIAARLWCIVAIIAVGFSAAQPFLLIRAYRTRERVVVLDPSGTFHVGPLLAFEEATKLHEHHALLACLAVFSRNPTGGDYPELLDKLFLPEAAARVRKDWAASSDEFTAKALHQKPEVLKLTVLETQDSRVLVQAEGQLVRTGVLRDQVFTEAPTFTARFTFARNPNLAANGRFPLAVWRYEISS